jgi:8-oxo-dGTP diphosphatase
VITPVVAAVIQRDDRFLVTRRQEGVHLAGLWEFPGGKINTDESHREALSREIREELDADLEVDDLVVATTHTYPEKTVRLYFYRCRLIGEPRPMIGQQLRWVTSDELRSLGFPAADSMLIRILTQTATQ